jgi:hypothetical protein
MLLNHKALVLPADRLIWLFQSGITGYGKVIGQFALSPAIVISKAYPISKDFDYVGVNARTPDESRRPREPQC